MITKRQFITKAICSGASFFVIGRNTEALAHEHNRSDTTIFDAPLDLPLGYADVPVVGYIVTNIHDVRVRGLQNVIRVVQTGEKVYAHDRIAVGNEPGSGLALALLPSNSVMLDAGGSVILDSYLDTTDNNAQRWPQIQLGLGRYEVRVENNNQNFAQRVRVVTPSASLVLYKARAAIDVDINETRVTMLDSVNSETILKRAASVAGTATDAHATGSINEQKRHDKDSQLSQVPQYGQGWGRGYSIKQSLISASTGVGDVWLTIPGHTVYLTDIGIPEAPQFISDRVYQAIANRFDYLV